ncbi:MAG: S9 family peptidase [Pseudomonadales bacterium]
MTRGQLVTLNVPDIPAATSSRVGQYANSRSARLLGFVGSELLIRTRFAQTNQVHRVAMPLGVRQQLTFFDEPVASVSIPPVAQPSGFIYGRDVGGAEFYQLFWFEFASGESRLLSDGRSRYGNVVFSDDGLRFAYSTTERDSVHHDIHVNDLKGNKLVVHESEAGWWAPLDFSPDGARLLLLKFTSIADSELFEADLRTGEVRALLKDRGTFSIKSAAYFDGGQRVVFAADLDSEFVGLHQLSLADGEVAGLITTDQWDVEAFALSSDSQHLAYALNVDGSSQLSVLDLGSGQERSLPEVPLGIIDNLQFHPTQHQQLGFTLYSPTAPGEAYSLDLTEAQLTRWTASEIGGLDASQFVTPSLIHYPTFDSAQGEGEPRQIPAFFFRPERSGPLPVVVLIHGGPEAQYRPYFSSTIQFLVAELGIAVIAPNVRGSAGYGKSYLKLDNGRLREDSVKDIGALLQWIATQEDLDAQRVAVFGGSYGGYMVLAALLTYPDRIAAGIESVGISNFVTFLENTQPYRQDVRRAEYGDERDPQMRAFLERISPLNQIDKLRAPLMISQGANDPRVPVSESEQIVAALTQKDIPVWYVLATDEGHSFSKQSNRQYNTAATALFLQRYLLSSGSQTP